MIVSLLKKTKSLKTTRKKQLKFLITSIYILQRPLLGSDPPQWTILIPKVKIELQLKESLNLTKPSQVL